MIAELPVQSTTRTSQEKLQLLYERTFPSVARFVSQMGGDLEDAKDIFQDALVIFYEKASERSFSVSPEAYLVGIAKHLWIRKYKKDQPLVFFDDFEKTIEIPEEKDLGVSTLRLLSVLEKSGKKCLELLKAFYYDKLSMQKIRDRFRYGSERSATVQKYKCIEKVRNEVKSKNLSYEDFFE